MRPRGRSYARPLRGFSMAQCQAAAALARQARFSTRAATLVRLRPSSCAPLTYHRMMYRYKIIRSPVGHLKLLASGHGLAAILWENDRPNRVRLHPQEEMSEHPVLLEAERQLNDYFAGNRGRFSVPLDFVGTEFQQKVWTALLTIPFGETRSYRQIAEQIGRPAAVRAVGAANGRNPISIIVPCHRVIGSNGALTGFAGGLEAKAYLLGLEMRLRGW
jgi:methylated-DNA-[protein]-cysteine S-methyltransferase